MIAKILPMWMLAVLISMPGPIVAECVNYEDFAHWTAMVSGLGETYDVAISGDYAYVIVGSQDLRVVDISNPERPVLVGSLDPPGTPDSGPGVAVAGSYVSLTVGFARGL